MRYFKLMQCALQSRNATKLSSATMANLSSPSITTETRLLERTNSPSHKNIHLHSQLPFGTKAAYPAPRNPLLIPYDGFDGVELVHVSLLARHGTRNPTQGSAKRMAELAAWFRQNIAVKTGNPYLPNWLAQFENNIAKYMGQPGELTEHGERELYGIGERFAAVYGNRFKDGQRGIRVKATSSNKTRAVESGNYFLKGFLENCREHGLTLASNVQVCSTGHEEVMRFYKCHTEYPTFVSQHKRLTKGDLEHGPLSTDAKRLASKVASELSADSPLPISLLRTLWESSAFEHAQGRSGKLANILESTDAILLEMFERHHRPCFKAHQRFRSATAPLVKDLADSLRNARDGTGVHADLRFAHAETLIPLLLLLEVLDYKELEESDQDYRAGLSALAPFAANLAIELYQQKKENEKKRFFVRFRMHERYINEVPALGREGNGEIDLNVLLAFFDKVVDDGMKYYYSKCN